MRKNKAKEDALGDNIGLPFKATSLAGSGNSISQQTRVVTFTPFVNVSNKSRDTKTGGEVEETAGEEKKEGEETRGDRKRGG